MSPLWMMYATWLAVLSAITFALYGWDKHQSQRDGWRVAERTLHLLAMAGGFPGALLGRRVFRHKSRKWAFSAVLWLIAAAHLAVVVMLVIWQSA